MWGDYFVENSMSSKELDEFEMEALRLWTPAIIEYCHYEMKW